MRTFSPQWLDLREPLDAISRASGFLEPLAGAMTKRQPARIVDLGAGTGANLRYLAPEIGGEQEWLLVDNDPGMAHAMAVRTRQWAASLGATIQDSSDGLVIEGARFACRVRSAVLDLATQTAELPFPEGALVTASALLDLVSESWLTAIAKRCRDSRALLLFALTYDGYVRLVPEDPKDQLALSLFNEHQLRDKGFGTPLGPTAPERALAILDTAGYQTAHEPSNWRVGPNDTRAQLALLDGWFEAAIEVAPDATADLDDWRQRRRSHIDAGRSRLVVGHQDLLAHP